MVGAVVACWRRETAIMTAKKKPLCCELSNVLSTHARRSTRSLSSTPSMRTCCDRGRAPGSPTATAHAPRVSSLSPRAGPFFQHDAQLDYYGKKLATCSSDRTIRVFAVDGDTHSQLDQLKGHEGPVWQVSWAHPRFGVILASCSYDGRVIIWKQDGEKFVNIKEHNVHTASGVASLPPHLSDLIVTFLHLHSSELDPVGASRVWTTPGVRVVRREGFDPELQRTLVPDDDGTWDTQIFDAHAIGCNAVTWAPAAGPGSLLQASPAPPTGSLRLATGGCDNAVKIWSWNEDTKKWAEDDVLEGHADWVRDLAWAPSIGLPKSYLASCSQEQPRGPWLKKPLTEKFADAVWRVSWSLAGNILAVSCGDNKVTLWKENLLGEWECMSELDDSNEQ
ncbi:MAG: WD40-repeat-containing domain protein [Olpidium bornovanus]|uniref:WD40-repeat-containing domain protein n=1 Tax=Olpidium bornovanus TaxID=278681 RepID=A0A8H8A036_9FUNG|nr:MAG: WD40-repeat-containing domain protein [Olpidium bornovanus]